MAQLEMFNEAPAVSAAPSAETVRARLEAIFATLRGADKLAWNELRQLKVIVPQMAQWLPEAERAIAVAEFERLLAAIRLKRPEHGGKRARLYPPLSTHNPLISF